MDKNSIHKSTSALIVLQHYAGVEIVCQSVACVAGAWMEVTGERENGRARGRHASVSPSRAPVFSCAH